MTIERLMLVELADIQGLRVVCKGCRAAVVFKLDETVYLPAECPSCQKQPWQAPGGQDISGSALRRLTSALKEWRQAERGSPYEIRLELAAPNGPPTGAA